MVQNNKFCMLVTKKFEFWRKPLKYHISCNQGYHLFRFICIYYTDFWASVQILFFFYEIYVQMEKSRMQQLQQCSTYFIEQDYYGTKLSNTMRLHLLPLLLTWLLLPRVLWSPLVYHLSQTRKRPASILDYEKYLHWIENICSIIILEIKNFWFDANQTAVSFI